MPENKMLICKPADYIGYVVPGSLPMKCCECGQPVWISPSSMLLLHDNPEMMILCEPCGFAHMEIHEGIIEDLIPAQLEELAEYVKSKGDK